MATSKRTAKGTTADPEDATIYDVASRAGVSIATVSRAINRSEGVSESTREKVLDATRELGYLPDRTARSLSRSSRDVGTLAVAVPTFTTPFHTELLKGIRARTGNLDIDLLLCDLEWERPEDSLRRFLRRGTIDGLVVAGLPPESALAEELGQAQMPTVLIGERSSELDSFNWNGVEGAQAATEHLIDQGHSRIGLITTHCEGATRTSRARGYRRALLKAGLEPQDRWVATGQTEKHAGFSEEAGREAMKALLKDAPELTAIFACSDVQAIGAWRALRESGNQVPSDMALVGYDDVKVSRFVGLTSVSQNVKKIGREATELLIRRLNGEGSEATVSRKVDTTLVPRRSSTGSWSSRAD